MSTQSKPYLTPEQYLEIERKAEFKSEYYRGEMFAMSGARLNHNLINWNTVGQFHQQLRSKPCQGYSNDMRVKVSDSGLYTYPDIAVVCGEARFLDDKLDTLLNPTLIVEILSPSTETYNRQDKFRLYRSLDSMKEYLLIASELVSAELFTRQPDGRWLMTEAASLDDTLILTSIDCRLKLADVYEKVEWPASDR
jgi:Uma2 family endonuclease